MKNYVERFWERANRKGRDECWIWDGKPILPRNHANYGMLRVDGKNMQAHRASWMIHNGRIPDGRLVLHQCDHKQCVNPAHLYLGNQADNVKDYNDQNPEWGGELKARRDMESSVKCLLADFRHEAGLTQVELGRLSGVSYRTIQDQEARVFRTPNIGKARMLLDVLSKELKRKLTIDDVWPE